MKMVSYSLFLEYVKDNILSYLPSEYRNHEVNRISTLKENGQKLEGIAIVSKKQGLSCAPAFYCEELYKMFQKSQDVEAVMSFIAVEYVKWDKAALHENLPDMLNFEEVKHMIGYSIVNERFNQEMLKDVVHKSEEDLTKVYRVFILGDDACKSAKVTNELLSKWGISVEELDFLADQNMPKLFPPVVMAAELMMLHLLDDERPIPTGVHVQSNSDVYIVTNKQLCGGASAIFYPNLLQEVREQMQEDFYVIPSSTEEVYLVPKRLHSAVKLGEQVRSGNRDVTPQNQVLSDCVYEYTRKNGQIRKVQESVLQAEKKRGMER